MAETLTPAAHRDLAASLFNHVWTLLETPDRTQAQDDEMLHAAHASRHHWGIAGTAVNLARGEWQVSRVYAVLGRAEPALHHARRCLELSRTAEGAADWDEPFAHEALARAYAVAGDADAARAEVEIALTLAVAIADAEDRAQLETELATVPLPAARRP
jgi:hypothetical protein